MMVISIIQSFLSALKGFIYSVRRHKTVILYRNILQLLEGLIISCKQNIRLQPGKYCIIETVKRVHFILFHVKMNKMYLKSIYVVKSFFKIRFEIELYECKSQMMHTNEGNAQGCVR